MIFLGIEPLYPYTFEIKERVSHSAKSQYRQRKKTHSETAAAIKAKENVVSSPKSSKKRKKANKI